MKTLFLMTLAILSSVAHSACKSHAIVYKRETNFGISLGGGSSSSSFSSSGSINLPIMINGEMACFKKSDAVSFEVKKAKKDESMNLLLTPLSVEFENVPDASVVQYFDYEFLGGTSSRLHLLSFVCSGETPLSKDSYTDTILGLSQDGSSLHARLMSEFAAGLAAQKLAGKSGPMSATEVHFSSIFMNMNNGIAPQEVEGNVYVPSVIAEFSANVKYGAVERKLFSSFHSKNHSSLNGCSKEFQRVLAPHLLMNVVQAGGKDGLSIKKKGKAFEITITY